jgi:hypothetical protein
MLGKYMVYLQNDDGSWWYFDKRDTEAAAKRKVADFLIAHSNIGFNIAGKIIKIRCADGHVSYYDRATLIADRNKNS